MTQKEKIMVKNLKDLKEIFDASGIHFWLDWGTLLGAMKVNGIFPWDLDIDLGALGSEYHKILAASSQIKKAGFLMNEVSIPIADSDFIYRRFGFYRSGYPVDLSLYYPRKEAENVFSLLGPGKFRGKFMRLLWLMWFSLMSKHVASDSKYTSVVLRVIHIFLKLMPRNVKISLVKIVKEEILKRNYGAPMRMVTMPKHYFENLKAIEFYGELFNAPSDVEGYLVLKYGADWRVPKNPKDIPSWDSKANI